MTDSLLLIDAAADVLRSVGDYFERIGYEVHRAATGHEGLEAFERVRPDVAILDLHLPDLSGIDVLERLRASGAAVIVMTGQEDIETAVRAMRLGAENFLSKPADLTQLAAATGRVAERLRLSRQNALLRARDHLSDGLETIGVSPAMRELARQVGLLASSENGTVLLTGESGTGKGWVARIIHQLSPRAAGPFVEVNCRGLSAAFLDSGLFGHEKGAFTDAKERRQGLFELADGGAIFLDEVGDLGLELQRKLLTVLETKTFRRLGGMHDLRVNVRLMAATNRDLVAAVKAGRFREDLVYRLSALPLHLPPLRERSREDRLLLLTRILAGLHAELAGGPGTCSTEALNRLLMAPWPGNVREMRSVLERAMILAQGSDLIGVEHLPADLRRGAAADQRHVPHTLAEVDRHHIERTLRAHGGNRTRAAQELGISRATLINKIKAYALDI